MKSFLEHWKPVEGYEGLYQVSDFGEVRSLGIWKKGKGNSSYFQEGRVLKPNKTKKGYLQVPLCKNGKMKMCKVHRLVAQAFIPNPYNLPEVNHIDENKENNKVCSGMVNLEWCDRKYNVNHGTGLKRMAEALSKKPIQLTLDYIFIKEWESVIECGRNGFNISCVSECCNNKYGKQGNVYKGFRWVYAEDYYKMFVA